MATCPYCSEEIQENAAKCKHCGEWLDAARHPVVHERAPLVVQSAEPDYSAFHKFWYRSSLGDSFVFAVDEEDARAQLAEKLQGAEVSRVWSGTLGKVSCPRCGNRYTVCNRDFGCIFLIIVFVSLGLGLLAIPFLPYHCKCDACGHRWKS